MPWGRLADTDGVVLTLLQLPDQPSAMNGHSLLATTASCDRLIRPSALLPRNRSGRP
jgi:hypothetical protein